MERYGSSSEIHVHCRTVLFVVNCWIWSNELCCRLCKIFCLSQWVFQAFMFFRGHYISAKINPGHSPYKVPFLIYETSFCCHTICIMYSRGLTLFYRRFTLCSITNVVVLWYEPVIYGSRSPKVHQGIIGIIYFRGLA
jgi:hypothetical protein